LAKIGEVEFLVNFDTMGKSFGDKLTEALQGADIDTGELDAKISEVNERVKLITTSFKGRREVDVVLAEAHLKKLEDPSYIEHVIENMHTSGTIMGALGFKGTIGTSEAKEFAREQMKGYFNDLADFIRITMSSDKSYFQNFTKLQTVQGLLNEAIEGSWEFVIKRVLSFLRGETQKIDPAVREIIKTWGGETGEHQTWWHKVITDIKPDKAQQFIRNREELIEATHRFFDMKELEKIFYGAPEEIRGDKELRKKIEEFSKKYVFGEGAVAPRGLLDAFADIFKQQLTGKQFYSTDIFKYDIKGFLKSEKAVKKYVEQYHGGRPPEEREEVYEFLSGIVEELGKVLITIESKTVGTSAQWAAKRRRYGEEEVKYMGFAAPAGSAEELSVQIGLGAVKEEVGEIRNQFQKIQPDLIIDALKSSKEASNSVKELIRTGAFGEKILKRLDQMQEELKSKKGTILGEK